MNNFHWTNIISLKSSQNDAFEKLLCQLVKKEDIQNKNKFIKVGNPDGGGECYVILDNGDEIGFQAKWFLSTPQDTQWKIHNKLNCHRIQMFHNLLLLVQFLLMKSFSQKNLNF